MTTTSSLTTTAKTTVRLCPFIVVFESKDLTINDNCTSTKRRVIRKSATDFTKTPMTIAMPPPPPWIRPKGVDQALKHAYESNKPLILETIREGDIECV